MMWCWLIQIWANALLCHCPHRPSVFPLSSICIHVIVGCWRQSAMACSAGLLVLVRSLASLSVDGAHKVDTAAMCITIRNTYGSAQTLGPPYPVVGVRYISERTYNIHCVAPHVTLTQRARLSTTNTSTNNTKTYNNNTTNTTTTTNNTNTTTTATNKTNMYSILLPQVIHDASCSLVIGTVRFCFSRAHCGRVFCLRWLACRPLAWPQQHTVCGMTMVWQYQQVVLLPDRCSLAW